jgi:hypothetical protein
MSVNYACQLCLSIIVNFQAPKKLSIIEKNLLIAVRPSPVNNRTTIPPLFHKRSRIPLVSLKIIASRSGKSGGSTREPGHLDGTNGNPAAMIVLFERGGVKTPFFDFSYFGQICDSTHKRLEAW